VRPIQRLAANGTALGCMSLLGIDRQLLGAAVPRRAFASARTTGGLLRFLAFRRGLRLLLLRLRSRLLLGALRRRDRRLRRLRLALLPRRPCARWPRAVGRVLCQPLACPLQILDRLAQQRPRLLWRQVRQGRLVELSEIVVAEVHSAGAGDVQIQAWTLSSHIRRSFVSQLADLSTRQSPGRSGEGAKRLQVVNLMA
jgi:hypothetical protein